MCTYIYIYIYAKDMCIYIYIHKLDFLFFTSTYKLMQLHGSCRFQSRVSSASRMFKLFSSGSTGGDLT